MDITLTRDAELPNSAAGTVVAVMDVEDDEVSVCEVASGTDRDPSRMFVDDGDVKNSGWSCCGCSGDRVRPSLGGDCCSDEFLLAEADGNVGVGVASSSSTTSLAG